MARSRRKLPVLAGLRFKMAYKCHNHQQTCKTHILLILVAVIIIINKINQAAEIKSQDVKQNNQQLESMFYALKLKRTNNLVKKTEKFQKTYIILLLLLSNDVHPNPGPKQSHSELLEACTMCKQEAIKEVSLQCDTCGRWCHITCTGANENVYHNMHNTSMEWICPTKTCSPNHINYISDQTTLTSPNRYKSIEKGNEIAHGHRKKVRKNIPQERKSPRSKNENPELRLLNELPKIASSDYILSRAL